MYKLFLVLSSLLVSSAFGDKAKICANKANDGACQQIPRKLDLACNFYFHDVDCLLSIQSNISHVGSITGEEAFLGANLVSDNVVVLGEIRSRRPPAESVVIIKSSIPSGFVNLKDKKLCHPGYNHDPYFSHLLLQELENKIIELNDSFCANSNVTLLEKHVQTLASFFGRSCRPGLWSQSVDYDTLLKTKYSSLCDLCGSQKCDVDYQAPFNDSMKCLSNNDGDIAVTTLSEAYQFFNKSTGNIQEYKYLCKDGSSQSASAPCTWSSQLPDLIVGERSVADRIINYFQDYLGSKFENLATPRQVLDDVIQDYLIEVLKIGPRNTISVVLNSDNSYKTLSDYVRERRTIYTFENSTRCSRTLNWCTYTDLEQEKCRWLSQAAINWGIQPVVQCNRSRGSDELSCLDDVKKQSADIVVASADYAYISLNKGLKSLAYPETQYGNRSLILAVKRRSDDDIQTFQDLKGKSACIPRFGGIEHLAFIDTLRKLDVIDETKCDYGKLLNDFIGTSCVPGARSSLIKESTEYVDQDKLCEKCRAVTISPTSSFCNDSPQNKFFGNEGALVCLSESEGDFAIISKFDAANDSSYQVICKNNSLASYPGLHVDKNCALTEVQISEIVSEASNPKNPDIILALYEFERWFGVSPRKSFHLFDRFNDTLDLLFWDSTPGLTFNEGDDEYIGNYKELLQNVKNCKESTSNSSIVTASLLTLVAFFIIVLLQN